MQNIQMNSLSGALLMQHSDMLSYYRDGAPVRATDSQAQTFLEETYMQGRTKSVTANTKYKCIIKRRVEGRAAETRRRGEKKKRGCHLA